MPHDLTHASFFSGVGGLDMGLERTGWRTVSFSEVDPYASAVLAQRWPGVPNLGSIVDLAAGAIGEPARGVTADGHRPPVDSGRGQTGSGLLGGAATATLWSGGFPCQDLSVAGKRRGMVEGTRSGLAYSFLALAERYRPRFVLLENVPGLLSSHGGRDMAALLGALVELGYGVGYRVLDARYFGVPQRRRRVFILGVTPGGRAGAELAAEVLSVGSRCDRHPAAGIEAGEAVATGAGHGVAGTIGTLSTSESKNQQEVYAGHIIPVGSGAADDARGQGRRRQGPAPLGGHEPDDGHLPDADAVRWPLGASPDPGRMRAPDGLAGRAHDRGRLVAFDPPLKLGSTIESIGWAPAVSGVGASGMTDDPLLPLGLDSHRYRCCGNGVVSDVSEWIGNRLREAA